MNPGRLQGALLSHIGDLRSGLDPGNLRMREQVARQQMLRLRTITNRPRKSGPSPTAIAQPNAVGPVLTLRRETWPTRSVSPVTRSASRRHRRATRNSAHFLHYPLGIGSTGMRAGLKRGRGYFSAGEPGGPGLLGHRPEGGR